MVLTKQVKQRTHVAPLPQLQAFESVCFCHDYVSLGQLARGTSILSHEPCLGGSSWPQNNACGCKGHNLPRGLALQAVIANEPIEHCQGVHQSSKCANSCKCVPILVWQTCIRCTCRRILMREERREAACCSLKQATLPTIELVHPSVDLVFSRQRHHSHPVICRRITKRV